MREHRPHRDPLQVALLGCGRMGREHLAAAAEVDDMEIVEVGDLRASGGTLAGVDVQAEPDVGRLIASPSVDAVLVASPTPTHAELVRAALEQGKHVLCEKPLTLDASTDLELEQLARENKMILQVGFWRRFAEPYTTMRELLAADRVGRVGAIRAAQWDAVPPPPAFCDPRVSGGLEIDCGVHELDLARWLLGDEVDSITACSPSASVALAAVGDVDTVCALARTDGARALAIDLARTAGHHDSIRTELLGEHGSLIAEIGEHGAVTVRSAGEREVLVGTASDTIATALRAQLRAFVSACRSGELDPNAATAHDSRAALLAAQAMRRARTAGTWITVAAPAGGPRAAGDPYEVARP